MIRRLLRRVTPGFNRGFLIVAAAFATRAAVVTSLIWALIPLRWPALTAVVAYISADIVQLVALPLLAWQAKNATDVAKDNRALLEDHSDHVRDSLAALHTHLGTGHGQEAQAPEA